MSAPSRTLLLVDDDGEVRRTLRAMLETRGHRVLEAPSAEAARGILAAEPVDLVFLDLGLPGESGQALCARIKAGPSAPKVVMLTVHDEPQAWAEGLGAGPDVYAVKPFGLERILMLVDHLLGEGA